MEPPPLPVESLAQSQSLAPVFLSIWPSAQMAPSGRISPKKARSPDMEAVLEMEAPPTISRASVKFLVPMPILPELFMKNLPSPISMFLPFKAMSQLVSREALATISSKSRLFEVMPVDVDQDKIPEPFVLKSWPEEPSDDGQP